MGSPLFTIGIPTFNRAGWVVDAIRSALNQTQQSVEVIVCDNASTDNTQDVVRQFGNQIRYIRNEQNIGAQANFCKLVDLAQGEYFSWLQDDDLINGRFVERAVGAFEKNQAVNAYAAYITMGPSVTNVRCGRIIGPPLSLNWPQEEIRLIDGRVVTAFSLWFSVSWPPVVAFRMKQLRNSMEQYCSECPLFNERTTLADVCKTGSLAVDPYVAGQFRYHDGQAHKTMQRGEDGESTRQWEIMASFLDELSANWNSDWEGSFLSVLEESPVSDRMEWLLEARAWKHASPFRQRARRILQQSIQDTGHVPSKLLESRGSFAAAKVVGRQLTPPFIWNGLRHLMGRS
jgi:glycosyltransferase involved in cell wall biosynthesis